MVNSENESYYLFHKNNTLFLCEMIYTVCLHWFASGKWTTTGPVPFLKWRISIYRKKRGYKVPHFCVPPLRHFHALVVSDSCQLRLQVRGLGSDWGLPCSRRGWRKSTPQIRRSGTLERWQSLWSWGRRGCLRGRKQKRKTCSVIAPFKLNPHKSCAVGGRCTHTEFDWKPRWKFHLNKLSQFVEVLERGYDLQHV